MDMVVIMNKKTKKVTIYGYSGKGNIGNEAIILGIIESLRNKMDNLEFTLLTDNPEYIKTLYKDIQTKQLVISLGLKRLKFKPLRTVKILKESDYFIYNPGALLDKHGESSWPLPSLFSFTVFFHAAVILLAKICKAKTIFYANMAGPFNAWFSRWWIRFVFNRIDLIMVRDYKSKERLLALGIEKEIHVTACPAYLTPTIEPSKAKELLEKENIDLNKKPLIGITLQGWLSSYMLSNKVYVVELQRQFAETIDAIIDKYKANIVFINMVFDLPPYKGDANIVKEVVNLMKNRDKVTILQDDYTIEETSGIISCMDIIIGMRLHSLVIAAVNNVPSIGIAPYEEFIYMFERFQDSKYFIKMHDFKPTDEVIELVGDLLRNRTQVSKDIETRVDELKRLAEKNAELVSKL